MITSRKIDDLKTPAKIRAFKFLSEAKQRGIDVLVTCTLRDKEAQDAIFAEGRSREELDRAGLFHVEPRPGPIRTNAKGGESFHQYGVALDVVPLRAGKPVWGDVAAQDRALWRELGEIGEACGLEWAGRWQGRLREMAHFQYTAGLRVADFRAGKTVPNEPPAPATASSAGEIGG